MEAGTHVYWINSSQWRGTNFTWKTENQMSSWGKYKLVNFRFGVLVQFLSSLKTDRRKEIIWLPWVTLLLLGSHEDKKGKNCFSQTNNKVRWPFHSLQSGCKTKWQTNQQMLSYKKAPGWNEHTCMPSWPSRESIHNESETIQAKRVSHPTTTHTSPLKINRQFQQCPL